MTKSPPSRGRGARPVVFDKLNLKDQRQILVVAAPESFAPELAKLRDVEIASAPSAVRCIDFALVFATRRAQLQRLARAVIARAADDALLWFAYPKATSKRYSCDFNRDRGWEPLRAAGFDSVRQIAIDADWSALRFRRTAHIRNSSRRPDSP